MKTMFRVIILLAVMLSNVFPQNKSFKKQLQQLLKNSKQIIVVTTDGWNKPTGILKCYQKKGNDFKLAIDTINVAIGKSGLAWGNGLVKFQNEVGEIKREGDKRSPAGVFSLPYAFGTVAVDSMNWLKIPYKNIAVNYFCVDDSTSEHYNKIVSTKNVVKNWNSSENMNDVDYKYGIVIGHNSNPIVKGCGSCIFFHLTNKINKPTAGCTAMFEAEFLKILKWIDKKKTPLLIQLPQNEFEKISKYIF